MLSLTSPLQLISSVVKLIFVFVCAGVLLPGVAGAQPNNLAVSGELEVSPFLIELTVEKGQSTQAQIAVTNRSERSLEIMIEARDFLPGQRGEPLFVPDTELNDPTFSLASWITVPAQSIVLQANETRTVNFLINPVVNAEQGTHYGAILFSYFGASNISGVGVNHSVGTILLLSYGQARSQGESGLSSSSKFVLTNRRIDFESYFNNTGNVHVKPKGEIYITDMWGRLVASPLVNRDAANVLPKSDRTFITSWFPSTLAFGRYKAESVIYYGREKLEVRDLETIWIFPWYLLLLLAIATASVIWFFMYGRIWYRKRVLKKHYSDLSKK